MPEEQSLRVALPENLRRQFARLEKRLFALETLMAVCFAIAALLGAFLIFFISDRFWDTPKTFRTVLLAVGIAGVALPTLWWLNRWVFLPRQLRHFAILVQKRYRRLGDRLLGIVELADEAKRPAEFSPELYRAAIEQVAAESDKYDFAEAVNPKGAKVELYLTSGLLLLVVLAAAVLPQASWNAFRRWIMPTASIDRFTLVELAALPDEQIVTHGENFVVKAKVNYRSFWTPLQGKAFFPGQRALHPEVKERELVIAVPAQMQAGKLQISLGDAKEEIVIRPEHRPALQGVTAQIKLPDYLGYPEQEEKLQGGSITMLKGSALGLKGTISRNLEGAEVRFGDQAPEEVPVEGATFSVPMVNVDGIEQVSLNWKDTLGLTNAAPWNLSLLVLDDAAPLADFPDLYRDTAMLETEVLPIKARVRDDYGVKMLGLDWQLESVETGTNSSAKNAYQKTVADQQQQLVEETFNFSPSVLNIPGDTTIEIRPYAVDYFPGRVRVEGPIYRVHVLGNAQHAEMIRQNLESLLVRLEEVTRLEERLANETRELKDLQKLDSPEALNKISELEKGQEQNAAQLKELAEEGMKTLREALRNPAFSEQLLTQWTKDLHEMQKLSEQQMKEASSSLESAAKSQQQEAREQKLGEALQKQEEIIEKLQEMQKEVNQGLDELQALTLAQRLRKVGGEQEKIQGSLQKNIPDTVGLMPKELPERYQKANLYFASQQMESQAESTKLHGEISRFYERTQKPNYGDVSKEMELARPADELDKIRGLIAENIGMEAMENLTTWADRFKTWAQMLEPKSEESGSGGGSGQGGGEQEDPALKQLLALLRMREKQVNIQERTRLLDEYIEEKTTYRDGAVLLAASQAKLNSDLTKQAVQNPFALLEAPYNDALNVMTDVESMLDRPQTDEVTRTAQNTSVGHLSDLINLLNEQAKQGQSSSNSQQQGAGSEEMAFLMQMMAPQLNPGMQAGPKGGGSMAGGSTDRTDGVPQGDSAGGKGEDRASRKASGMPANYPTEFRPALEKYFKALEQE